MRFNNFFAMFMFSVCFGMDRAGNPSTVSLTTPSSLRTLNPPIPSMRPHSQGLIRVTDQGPQSRKPFLATTSRALGQSQSLTRMHLRTQSEITQPPDLYIRGRSSYKDRERFDIFKPPFLTGKADQGFGHPRPGSSQVLRRSTSSVDLRKSPDSRRRSLSLTSQNSDKAYQPSFNWEGLLQMYLGMDNHQQKECIEVIHKLLYQNPPTRKELKEFYRGELERKDPFPGPLEVVIVTTSDFMKYYQEADPLDREEFLAALLNLYSTEEERRIFCLTKLKELEGASSSSQSEPPILPFPRLRSWEEISREPLAPTRARPSPLNPELFDEALDRPKTVRFKKPLTH